MTGTRGPRSHPLPKHPANVLAAALKTGLSTAVYIQRAIHTTRTRYLCRSSESIWNEAVAAYRASDAAGKPDLRSIAAAEHNVRKNGLDIVEVITAAYGNTESSRSRGRDDQRERLNQSLDAGGSSLRDMAMTRYPMPESTVLADDSQGERLGYRGNSTVLDYELIHRTLPELDFMDACRMHVQVLCSHCYIYGVPIEDVRRYCNLFLLRARPYLDHIYTEHVHGAKSFRIGTTQLLRTVKDDIAGHYPLQDANEKAVTSSEDFQAPEFSMEFFSQQLREAEESGLVDPVHLGELRRLLDGGSIVARKSDGSPAPCLTERDVEHLWNAAVRKSRKTGSRIHRRIAKSFASPWNIERAILSDQSEEKGAVYKLVAETPLQTSVGRGRADLVLLRREAASKGFRILWRPVMVIEIKNISGFRWSFKDETKWSQSRASAGLPQRVAPSFGLAVRALDSDEWSDVLDSAPTQAAEAQLQAYAAGIRESYRALADLESSPPVAMATLVIDSAQNLDALLPQMSRLVIGAFESLVEENDMIRLQTYVRSSETSVHAALVFHEQPGIRAYKGIDIAKPWEPPYDPLYGSSYRKGRFVLCLSASSPTSGGRSAAWIAGYTRLVDYMRERTSDDPKLGIVWIDLADDFVSPILTEVRLKLSRNLGRDSTAAISRIHFLHLFGEIERFLYSDGPTPDFAESLVREPERPLLVLVSGWETVDESTPGPYRSRLNPLLAELIQQIPESRNVEVFWLGVPMPDERNSAAYQARCLLPFYSDSPLYGEVNEILWNLPVAPMSRLRSRGWSLPAVPEVPAYDDIRVIITQNRSGYDSELVYVPSLEGWSARFRSEKHAWYLQKPRPPAPEPVPDGRIRTRMRELALDTIPWIETLWPMSRPDYSSHPFSPKDEEELSITPPEEPWTVAERTTTAGSEGSHPVLLDRLRFRPDTLTGARAYVDMTAGRINSHRFYRRRTPLVTGKRAVRFLRETHQAPREPLGVLFGQAVRYDCDGALWAVIVIQSPLEPWRTCTGLLPPYARTDAQGFRWTDTRFSDHIDSLRSVLESSDRTDMAITRSEGLLYAWEREEEGLPWELRGTIECITSSAGPVHVLRAVRMGATVQKSELPSVPVSSAAIRRIVDGSVRRLVSLHDTSVLATMHLSWNEDMCLVTLKDAGNIKIHMSRYTGLADVVAAATACSNGLPTVLESGRIAYWDRYRDIDYGAMPHIANLVEISTDQRNFLPVPPRVDLLRVGGTGPEVKIQIEHDADACPLSTGTGVQHDRCWRLSVLDDNHALRGSLEGTYTDRELFSLVGLRSAHVGGVTYRLKLQPKIVPQSGETIALQESPLIVRILMESGIRLRVLTPGTHLKAGTQMWLISVTAGRGEVTWAARSSLTGEYFSGSPFTVPVDLRAPLEIAEASVWDAITFRISSLQIERPEALKTQIRFQLAKHGWKQYKDRFDANIH